MVQCLPFGILGPELLMTLFSTMFCDIKSEYCLDFINLFGLVWLQNQREKLPVPGPQPL